MAFHGQRERFESRRGKSGLELLAMFLVHHAQDIGVHMCEIERPAQPVWRHRFGGAIVGSLLGFRQGHDRKGIFDVISANNFFGRVDHPRPR